MTYKKNTRIPGWNAHEILDVIGKYASEVPSGGNILEIGALFGRTTYTLGFNKRDDVKLTTIDCWEELVFEKWPEYRHYDNFSGDEETALIKLLADENPMVLSGNNFYKLWKHFTAGIQNLHGMRAFSDIPNNDMPMYDLIIHDAAHDYKWVYADLRHWYPKLKPGCPMIIDDYEPQFPGLMQAVDQFVMENNLLTEMVTSRNILIRGR